MKKSVLLIISAILLVSLLPISAASGTLPVIRAEFPVVVNGRIVDNAAREYPFILCNSVTYFPMTYEDCAFLGLSNDWTAAEGNIITKTESSGYYKDFIDPEFTYRKKGETATVVTSPVTVLGVKINNAAETYPILNYKNVLYFPLTWDWGQKFGWNITFSEDKILEVTTEGFEDAGCYYTYDISGSEATKITNKLADTNADSLLYGSYGKSKSPDYAWGAKNTAGLVTLFRLLDVHNEERLISVKEDMVPYFLSKGWYRVEDANTAVYEFIKTHSMGDLITATNGLKSGDLYSVFNNITDDIMNSYTTLYYGDNTCTTIPDSEVYSYTASGWMKADDYAIDAVNYCESRKSYGMAMTILEKNLSYIYGDIPGYPYPDFSEFDYALGEELYRGIRQRYAEYVRSGVVVRLTSAEGDTPFIIFDCVIPDGQYLKSMDISYDLVDSVGNVVLSVNQTEEMYVSSYGEEGNTVKSSMHYLNDVDNPYVVGIANVKVSNFVYDDYYNMPMGQG